MNEPVRPPQSVAKVTEPSGSGRPSTVTSGDTAFRALLDRLEASAAGLRRDEASISSAGDLATAMTRARESFDDALVLGRDLLESLRQNQLQEERRPAPPVSDDTP